MTVMAALSAIGTFEGRSKWVFLSSPLVPSGIPHPAQRIRVQGALRQSRARLLGWPDVSRSSNIRFVAAIALRYGRGLRRFLSVHLRNAQDVPDLAQEVYLRLLRVDHHEAIRNPEAYVFTVASHLVRQHSLRRSSEAAFMDITEAVPELALPAGEEPSAKVENSQRLERFQKEILSQLPPRVGAALVLHRIHGYSVRETASRMGVTRETVKGYLADAAKRCRKTEGGGGQSE